MIAAKTHERVGDFTLEIDFLDGRALTLTVWKNGDKPGVLVWTGREEHEFKYENVESFKDWAENAVGKSPSEPIPHACR
jgi:hypothetical protein